MVDPVILKASKSIEYFGKVFMAKALSAATPQFHKAIYADLENNSIEKLGIVAPRGHSKSTVVSVIYPMWRIIFKPDNEDLLILLISEAQSQSVNFVSIIKYNLAFNPRILDYFGSLEGPKWTEEEIVTSNGAKLVARGTGQRIRGTLAGRESITRPNLIILDDFESETNSGTPEAIDKNKKWIAKAVEPSLADDGRMVAIGTIITERAYLKDIEKDETWKCHFYQAIMNNKSLWPERFSMKRLMRIKKSYEDRGEGDAFWQEYMNTPINLETQTFKQVDFTYWTGEFQLFEGLQPALKLTDPDDGYELPTWTPVTVCIGVDLAISEDRRADFTVIAPLAMDAKERRFMLPYSRLKTKDIDVIVDEMIEVCKRYGASLINIETVQYQQAVAEAFRKAMDKSSFYVTVRETKPRTGKDARIKSLQPYFRSGGFYHQRHMTELEAEFLAWPKAAHDDIPDAIYFANKHLTPPDLEPFVGTGIPEPLYQEEESWLVM